jgi:uncharacterized protein (UPF0332 family)
VIVATTSRNEVNAHKWIGSERFMRLLRITEPTKYGRDESQMAFQEMKLPSTKDLIAGAESSLRAAKTLVAAGEYTWAFVPAYCSMFHSARALLANAYLLEPREADHSVLLRVAENYKRVANGAPDMKGELLWLAEVSMRDRRNDIVHSGLNHLHRELTKDTVARAQTFLAKVKIALKSVPPLNSIGIELCEKNKTIIG